MLGALYKQWNSGVMFEEQRSQPPSPPKFWAVKISSACRNIFVQQMQSIRLKIAHFEKI